MIFDDDLGHGNHSGELLLFVGCFVNFVVSYLICMFQDSVPAGSYNDPFLSSVWNIWTDVKLLLQSFSLAGGQEPMIVCPGQRRPDSMGVQTYFNFPIFDWHGKGLSREPLHDTFISSFARLPRSGIYLFTFWIIFEPVLARDLGFRNFITKIAYYFLEIYLGSTLLFGCSLLGFSSHRVTSMIQFLSSVCLGVCVWVSVCRKVTRDDPWLSKRCGWQDNIGHGWNGRCRMASSGSYAGGLIYNESKRRSAQQHSMA